MGLLITRSRLIAAAVLVGLLVMTGWAQPTPSRSILVKSFKVEGMKTLDAELAQGALDSYLNRPLTFAQLEAAAQEIVDLYREHDYFTVSAYLPEQKLSGDSVTIKVVESTLNEVEVEGNARYSTEYLKWMLEPVVEDADGGLPRRSILQRQLLLLGDNMDLDARSVVEGTDNKEKVDLLVQVDDDLPTHLTLDYNNLGARTTGRNRLGATFQWGNFTNRADMLTLRYVESDILNANVEGLDLFSLGYKTPINNHGTSLNFSYANSAFQVGRELQVLDIRGDADVFSLTVDHPIVRGPDANLYIDGGFIFQDIQNTILGTQLSRDRLREVVLGLRGDWTSGSGRNYAGGRITQDLGTGLGGLSPNDPFSSRQAGGGFTKMTFDLARVQRINQELYAIFRGHHQTGFSSLPFAEQYGLGGINTVRGYLQSAYLGDTGYNVNAELRWAPLEDNRELLEIGFFLDHGASAIKRPFPGEIPNVALTGAGAGIHLRLPEETYIRAEVGVPLGNSPITARDGDGAVPYLIFSKRF